MIPQVSIIIPIASFSNNYFGILDFLKNMPQGNLEVIVCYDMHLNRTSGNFLLDFKSIQDKRVILLKKLFNGPGQARNEGLHIATGKWIAFWDSDDYIDVPEFCQTLAYLENCSYYDVIVNQFSKIDSASFPIVEIQATKCMNKLDLITNPGFWRMIFKSSTIKEFTFPNLLLGEDLIFLLSYRLLQRKIVFTNFQYYKYVIKNQDSLTTHQGNHERQKDFLRELTDQKNYQTSLENIWVQLLIIRSISKINFMAILIEKELYRDTLKRLFFHPLRNFIALSLLMQYRIRNIK